MIDGLVKLQYKRISDSIRLCLRKKTNNYSVTNLLDKNFVDNLKQQDIGYDFLECERLSPVFWERKKKEVIAMVRQLGTPAFFFTLSAGETKWPYLLISLMKIVKKIDITYEQAERLTNVEKKELISKDPVTCSRYFDHRIKLLFSI